MPRAEPRRLSWPPGWGSCPFNLAILPGAALAGVSAAATPEPGSASLFTPREQDVLKLLAEGLPNKGVASRLEVSEHTVKFHVNSIMGKLNAQSRTEAVILATRLGLLPL